ncbi:lmo0937 family membrane protein [Tamlana sp. 2_MG-2023]|nr:MULTISPECIES: lmo0937 family membrane protein [unclassified Tamlana]MDO6760204.1 lmo0937 family membrane protein [Tamlana sp. 2_MG-2023]MDO6790098.1 lmo0937 family membrane protein [Tamlana sp. 1_MG-2023]
MRNILWFVAAVCILTWILGFFGVITALAVGGLIHILLIIALIAILNNLIDRRGL